MKLKFSLQKKNLFFFGYFYKIYPTNQKNIKVSFYFQKVFVEKYGL